MARAFIFPGQGSQIIGMGRDLATDYPAARAVFEEVDDALGETLSALIWNGEADALMRTANAQPALLAMSMAVMRALEAEGVTIDAARYVAGHSLGEYSALTAAGSFTVADAARLLRLRGEAMQAAVPEGQGAMAAILGLGLEDVRHVAAAAAQGEVCAAANDNDPKQVVISGTKAAVDRAIPLAQEAGAKRGMLLAVSAPFHCALMQPAAEVMRAALGDVAIATPRVPVVANVVADAVTDPDRIRALLAEQVTGTVRWRESVAWMAGAGVTEFWEIGAGRALSGMVRRIHRAAEARTVGSTDEVRAAAAAAGLVTG